MQFVLAHANRRIRPDGHEGDVRGNILGAASVDIDEAQRLGVPPYQVKGTLVDIHSPHGRARGRECESESDRPPAATEVQQVSAGRRRRSVREENLRSRVNSVRAEDAIRGGEVIVIAGQTHANGTKLKGTCG